jgi:hypothetical protein
MDRAIGRSHEREAVPSRLWLAGGAGGLITGIAMGMSMMIDSAATGMGFWSPLEVCMASFVYRSEVAMIEKEMMMHPGAPMMMGPLNVGRLAVGRAAAHGVLDRRGPRVRADPVRARSCRGKPRAVLARFRRRVGRGCRCVVLRDDVPDPALGEPAHAPRHARRSSSRTSSSAPSSDCAPGRSESERRCGRRRDGSRSGSRRRSASRRRRDG